MRAQVLQPCPTLCNPVDCNLQASLFMGFSRQEYWSELPCPPPGDLPDPGIEPAALHCRWILCPLSHLESPNREEKVKMGRAMKRKTKENVK